MIGVRDNGAVHGLESDYQMLHKEGRGDRDVFLGHLTQRVINSMGDAAASLVEARIFDVGGKDVCRVHVQPCGFAVEAEVVVDRKGQHVKETKFYVRQNNGTHEITDPDEKQKYIESRWGPTAS